MLLKPTGDKILVEIEQFDPITKSGIYLPHVTKQKSNFGKVAAVGPGRPDNKGKITPIRVKPGQKIVFSQHGGTLIEYEGIKYLVLTESNILAILEG